MLIFFSSRQKARNFASKLQKSPIDRNKQGNTDPAKRWAVDCRKTK